MGQGAGFGMITAGLLSAGIMLSATAVGAQTTVHVSPDGNDRNPGSAARPVKSLTRAQALVRSHNRSEDVTVEIAGGTYRLDQPLVFNAVDGGQGGHRVIWQARPG
ncbi:hypothetical protein D3C80_894680 [compost metagenome]